MGMCFTKISFLIICKKKIELANISFKKCISSLAMQAKFLHVRVTVTNRNSVKTDTERLR